LQKRFSLPAYDKFAEASMRWRSCSPDAGRVHILDYLFRLMAISSDGQDRDRAGERRPQEVKKMGSGSV